MTRKDEGTASRRVRVQPSQGPNVGNGHVDVRSGACLTPRFGHYFVHLRESEYAIMRDADVDAGTGATGPRHMCRALAGAFSRGPQLGHTLCQSPRTPRRHGMETHARAAPASASMRVRVPYHTADPKAVVVLPPCLHVAHLARDRFFGLLSAAASLPAFRPTTSTDSVPGNAGSTRTHSSGSSVAWRRSSTSCFMLMC